jgi:hypothetical protein
VQADATANTAGAADIIKSIEASGDATAATTSEADVTKVMNAAGDVTLLVSAAPVDLVKNMNFEAQAVATTVGESSITKSMDVQAQATAATEGVAAITKVIAFGGATGATTDALLGIQKLLAAEALCAASGDGSALFVDKPISGAGDEFTDAIAELAITVNFEGMTESFALSDTTLHLTKISEGYLAAASVVEGNLRRLYIYNSVLATFEVGELASSAQVDDILLRAEVEELESTAAVQTLSVEAGADAPVISAEIIGGISIQAELESVEFRRAA